MVPILLACFPLGGCSILPHKKKQQAVQAEQGTEPRRVGSVALVNEKLRFVLVDTGTLYQPAHETALKTFTNGLQTGVLSVSKERKPPFVAADIVQGAPGRGDDVFE
jgi:hypothetical protein